MAEDLRRTSIFVDGMTCAGGCGGRLTRALEGLNGVLHVRLEFAKRTVTVMHDASIVSLKDLFAAIRALGNEGGRLFTPIFPPPSR